MSKSDDYISWKELYYLLYVWGYIDQATLLGNTRVCTHSTVLPVHCQHLFSNIQYT